MEKRIGYPHIFYYLTAFVFLSIACFAVNGAFAAQTDTEEIAAAMEKAAQARSMAHEGRQARDAEKIAMALALADEASRTLQAIAQSAADSGNTELAWEVMTAMERVGRALDRILDAAASLAATSTDPATANAASSIVARAETAKDAIGSASTQLANAFPGELFAGGTPGEPEAFEEAGPKDFSTPLGDEAPPINDAVEASPT